MTKLIFVNLPVTDLSRSTAFHEALGMTKDTQFSDAFVDHFSFMAMSSRPSGKPRWTSRPTLVLRAS
jgi:predicted lactoylglutathione lyase